MEKVLDASRVIMEKEDFDINVPPLSDDEKAKLMEPIEKHLNSIQKEIDALRVNGENKIMALKEEILSFKKNKDLNEDERKDLIDKNKELLLEAKLVRDENSARVKELILEGEEYLKENYSSDYGMFIKYDTILKRKQEQINFQNILDKLNEEHMQEIGRLQNFILSNEDNLEAKENAKKQLKEENRSYKNKKYDAKVNHQKVMQNIRDEKHNAFLSKYHFIDLLRNSRFTFSQKLVQYGENKAYTFHLNDFLLKNGLSIIIILFFLVLVIIAPIKEGRSLITATNIFSILENSSTRIFFALGVAGLILLAGTDLSIGRMVGLSATLTAIIWHQGDNAIKLFGSENALNFDAWPIFFRLLVSLLLSVILCSMFSAMAGFFTAKFKMHPFISTMANQLIIYGLWFYITKGTASGGVDDRLVNVVAPKWGMFPSIVIWSIACIAIVWFIWNKTRFGKNMYAVGGNQEAAAVSGISVFWTTILVFIMAGILYGLGGWLECARAKGSASAGTGSGWETDAIAACVVGGISFSGGIGKIGGAVFGVVIFTALSYALAFLRIDTNLQFVIKGIIILAAVAMDSIKYLKKK